MKFTSIPTMKVDYLTFFLLLIVKPTYTQLYDGDDCIVEFNNQPGICRPVNDCPSAKEQFDQFGAQPTRCGFQGNTLIICCNEKPSISAKVVNDNNGFLQSSERISEKKCKEYSKSVTKTLSVLLLMPNAEPITDVVADCDYGKIELIVGGESVKHGEFPHMAVIGWELHQGGYQWNCGGTLISELYVLTAGHCLYKEDPELKSAEPGVVRLGEYDISSADDGANPVDILIESMIPHPNYAPPKKYNDISLIKLARQATFNKFIRPACLWTKSTLESDRATATGWGYTAEDGRLSDSLQKVVLNVFDQNLCKSLHPPRRRDLKEGIIESQMCSGQLRGGQDTCQGDSGGPLQVQSKSNQCVYFIIGVTSYGTTCGSERGGVYSRVSSYVDWIESQVWP